MAKKKKPDQKLNAMRVLEVHGVSYQVFTFPPHCHSASAVAEQAGVPPEQVYKTLVVQRERGKPLLVVIAEKRLRMAPQREAEQLTGLLVGGISPLALLNRGFDIFLDQKAREQDRIYISAGKRGVNLIVAVDDLLRVTSARLVAATD
jgi:Cys-tRNA(Pro)/Cys-tRNA(Cys) deacylase